MICLPQLFKEINNIFLYVGLYNNQINIHFIYIYFVLLWYTVLQKQYKHLYKRDSLLPIIKQTNQQYIKCPNYIVDIYYVSSNEKLWNYKIFDNVTTVFITKKISVFSLQTYIYETISYIRLHSAPVMLIK